MKSTEVKLPAPTRVGVAQALCRAQSDAGGLIPNRAYIGDYALFEEDMRSFEKREDFWRIFYVPILDDSVMSGKIRVEWDDL